MRRGTLGLLVALMIGAAGLWLTLRDTAHAADAATAARPRFVLNLTSGLSDIHRTTMALALANHALDDGREVVIFLNVRAPEIARKDAPEAAFAANPPPTKMLAALIQRGAQVHVCPMCMKGMNVESASLIPGCTVTDREKLFSKLTADAVVFSY